MENPRKIKLFGDRQEAMRKYGQGQALLRATKAISELLGIPYHRLFNADKTVVTQSISGMQDQIILSHTPEVKVEEEEENPNCTIILINVPEVIPPMKWYAPGLETFTKVDNVWVIKDPNGVVEVEGVDYIKTYYRLNITDCNECSPLISTVCKTEELALARCHPYIYDATKLLYQGSPVPYFQGWPLRVPPVPPDPKNHLIHSFYESGQAEILKFGSDSQGSYFLWKAYTEWWAYPPTSITFSRTGLGYLLLKAFIQFEGIELCKTETIIKVDCCEKPVDARKVEIWWEDFGICQPFMIYPGVVYNSICKMPTSVPISGTSGLVWYGCTYPQQPLYAIPEIKGSCLPVEWTLTGPIALWGSDKNDNIIYFKCLEAGCNEPAFITLRDRCGTEYIVRGKPCCEEAAPLSINYTSLLMSCGQYQTLTALGGCGPYSWSISSGGGTLNTNTGSEVIYHAPATNANCTNNPTVQVTDCCGNTAQISLAVNCYTGGNALKIGDATQTECYWAYYDHCHWWGSYYCDTYDCAGTLTIHTAAAINLYENHDPDCIHGSEDATECTMNCGLGPHGRCADNTLCGLVGWLLNDIRTQAMKDAGCCPLNPFTGLPY